MSEKNISHQILSLAVTCPDSRAVICGSLSGDYFYGYDLQLFNFITQCYNKNLSLSWPSVSSEMERQGVDDEFVSDIQLESPSPDLLDSYIDAAKMNTCINRLTLFQSEISKNIRQCKNYSELQTLSEKGVRQVFDVSGISETLVSGFTDVLPKVNAIIKERAESEGNVYGIETGIDEFDKITCGYQDGDLIIVAARPSMGKTSFALSSLERAMKKSYAGMMFSLEMPNEQLAMRMLSSFSGIPLGKLRSGNLSDTDLIRFKEAHDFLLYNNKLRMADTGGLTFSEMKRMALAEHARNPLSFILIDYLQLMSLKDAEGNTKSEQLGWVTANLKTLAKELNLPIILLSQLSRNCESRADKRPMNSDLRESGAIEQDADLIIFIYRDVMYNEDTTDPDAAELIVSKQRNGPTGTAKSKFHGATTSFTSYTVI